MFVDIPVDLNSTTKTRYTIAHEIKAPFCFFLAAVLPDTGTAEPEAVNYFPDLVEEL